MSLFARFHRLLESQNATDSFDGRIAGEGLFRRTLYLERRRAERAGARFGLVIVSLEGLNTSRTREKAPEIATAISGTIRETDTIGWHRQFSTIGIILTALSDVPRQTIETAISRRIRKVLSLTLDASQAERIRISLHVFPDDEDGMFGDNSEQAFYPDQRENNLSARFSGTLKRAIDMSGSLVALMILLPVFLVIPVLIKLTSPGPIFFRQQRVGQLGRRFTFLKFRSMYLNSDPAIHKEYVRNLISKKVGDSEGAYKIKHDPRVTPLGRFLRKSSLDELPQFINVLRGDMSLVGPRPPIPYEFESYSVWHRRRVLEAKPGITGAWQVDGRSRTTFDDMVRMDLRYARNRSFWVDTKILLKTPFAVLRGSGAY